jgi:outer membrane translocation and assembly module TamA
MADGRLRAAAHFTRLHADAVNFYGIGNDTRRANRRRYEYDPTTIGGKASWQVTPWFGVGGGLDYLDSRATLRVDDEPRQDVQYTVARASAAVDWRDSPGYSRRGGMYKIETSTYAARRGDPFSFRRNDAEVVQLWPILRAQWVVAVRGLVTTTHTGADDTIPYFMLPSLGGGSSLRGFRSWRFRDRHRLLLSAEYRWTPGELLDMALFYDTGKVAPRVGDLDLRALHHDYGISLRIHSPTFTGLRADLARSREGWVFRLGSGTAF